MSVPVSSIFSFRDEIFPSMVSFLLAVKVLALSIIPVARDNAKLYSLPERENRFIRVGLPGGLSFIRRVAIALTVEQKEVAFSSKRVRFSGWIFTFPIIPSKCSIFLPGTCQPADSSTSPGSARSYLSPLIINSVEIYQMHLDFTTHIFLFISFNWLFRIPSWCSPADCSPLVQKWHHAGTSKNIWHSS